MADLTKKKKEVNIDFSLQEVWGAILKAVAELDWEIVENNSLAYEIKIRALQTISFYDSTIQIELISLDQETTHIIFHSGTPVEATSSAAQFDQPVDEVEDFISVLCEILNR